MSWPLWVRIVVVIVGFPIYVPIFAIFVAGLILDGMAGTYNYPPHDPRQAKIDIEAKRRKRKAREETSTILAMMEKKDVEQWLRLNPDSNKYDQFPELCSQYGLKAAS